MPIPESETDDLLEGHDQENFVQDQIKNLDQHFQDEGLDELKSTDRSSNKHEARKNMLLNKIYELED